FDDWPTRVTKPEQLRDFIESLARRVVARPRYDFVLAGLGNEEDVCVTARNDQRLGRVFNRRVLERNRVDVTFNVVDADERFLQRVSHGLRVRNTDEQRTNEPRSDSDGNTIDVASRNAGAFECFRDHG